MLLLGYVPKDLPYDEKTIFKEINGLKADKELIFRMIKRRMLLDYIFDILKPILQFQETGCLLKVGMGGKIINAFPHLVMITGYILQNSID
jgi:hypothetical protein